MDKLIQINLTVIKQSEPLKILDGEYIDKENNIRIKLYHYLNGLILINNSDFNQYLSNEIIPIKYKDFKIYNRPFNSKVYCELIKDNKLKLDNIYYNFNFWFSYGSKNLIFNTINTLDKYFSSDIFKNICFKNYIHLIFNYNNLFSSTSNNCIIPLSNIYDKKYDFIINIIDKNTLSNKSFIKNIHTFKNLELLLNNCIEFKPIFNIHSIYYNYEYSTIISKKGKRLEPNKINYGIHLYISELIIYTTNYQDMIKLCEQKYNKY